MSPAGVPGRPDVYFPTAKLAIFVHGCFWHCCPTCYRAPTTNAGFWRKKALENQKRDQSVVSALVKRGDHVLVFWEHELTDATLDVGGRVSPFLHSWSRRQKRAR